MVRVWPQVVRTRPVVAGRHSGVTVGSPRPSVPTSSLSSREVALDIRPVTDRLPMRADGFWPDSRHLGPNRLPRRIAKGLSARTEQGKEERLLLATVNVARTGRLRQGPDRCAESPAEPEATERRGVAYGRACGGDRRRRSDGDDAGG